MVLTRRLAWLALALSAPACIHHAALVHLETATPVAVVLVLDDKTGSDLEAAPPELRAAIERELARRNLVPQVASPETLAPLKKTRNTRTRSELLAKALGPGHLFLLVELKVQFFGQFEGGYKWNVDGELTVSQTDQLDAATAAPLGVAAFLAQDFEREREAMQQTSTAIADRVGELFDEHFAGRVP